MESAEFPQYLRIAIDIASKIALGEYGEQQKLSGRSVLSSEYRVSPETIRRAVRLLADVGIVDVREKSGVVILSAEKARNYLENFRPQKEQQALREELRSLVAQYRAIGQQMLAVGDKLMNASCNPLPSEAPLPNYELPVPPGSRCIGQSLGALHFWQSTGATIIAIRRGQNILISPGPYAQLCEGDLLVFVGSPKCVAAVAHFLSP